jgi:hypothetical protein
MNLRTIVAAIAGAIVMFLLGWLFFGILLMEFFKNQMINYPGLIIDPPRFVCIFLWNLVWCWLIAFIFDYWATIRTFVGGLKGGAIIMFAIVLGVNLSNYAFMNIYKGSPFVPMIVDVLVAAVMGAVAGGVIGFVLGKMNKN